MDTTHNAQLLDNTAGITPAATFKTGGALPAQGAAVWLIDSLAPIYAQATAQGHFELAQQLAEKAHALALTVGVIENVCFAAPGKLN